LHSQNAPSPIWNGRCARAEIDPQEHCVPLLESPIRRGFLTASLDDKNVV